MKSRDNTEYLKTRAILIKNGVPESFLDDLTMIVDDFEKHHSELFKSNKQAFYTLLLGTVYKMGYIEGKAAAK